MVMVGNKQGQSLEIRFYCKNDTQKNHLFKQKIISRERLINEENSPTFERERERGVD